MADMKLPALLIEAFDGDEDAVAWTLALKDWMVAELSAWVMEPKSDASRKKRAERMAERLMLTMEAERELPVFLVRALNEAGAMKGWKALTERQRLIRADAYKECGCVYRLLYAVCDVMRQKGIWKIP